jgi:hypothetical protein
VSGEHRIAVTVAGDRQAAEALQLELRRLARRYGLAVTDVRVERARDEDARGAGADPA